MKNLVNKIHLVDSLEFMKQNIEDNSIDLIVTDPPYIVDTTPCGKSSIGNTEKLHSKKYWEKKGFETKLKYNLEAIKDGFDVEAYFNEFERVLKKFNAFVFCSNKQITEIMSWGEKRGYITTLLVWVKTNTTPFANGTWRSSLEYIVHIREKGATFNGNAKLKEKHYISPTVVSKWGHPTEKPIDLIKKFVEIGSNDGDLVFDPFMGSGTTAQACINLNRDFIGCEIEEVYLTKAQERIDYALGNVGLLQFAS